MGGGRLIGIRVVRSRPYFAVSDFLVRHSTISIRDVVPLRSTSSGRTSLLIFTSYGVLAKYLLLNTLNRRFHSLPSLFMIVI